MDEQLAIVKFVSSANLGVALKVQLVVDILTQENVQEVIESLPTEFRNQFIQYTREAYVPEGKLLVLKGEPTPDTAINALRFWFAGAIIQEFSQWLHGYQDRKR